MKKSYSYIGINGGYKLLKKIKITYTDDHTNVVAILPHKDTGLYSYINLTKGHICPCCFASIEEAFDDLSHYPNIKKWEIINEEITEENASNDLISRKSLLEKFKRWLRLEHLDCNVEWNKAIKRLIAVTKDEHSSYDIDSVCDELENYLFEKYCIEGDDQIDVIIRNGGKKE